MKDSSNLLKKLDLIILQHRNYIFQIPLHEHVFFIMSGGLDSTIGAAWAIEEWKCIVHPLFIRRSSRSGKWEEKAFDLIVKDYSKRYPNHFIFPRKINVSIPPKDLRLTPQSEKSVDNRMVWRNFILQSLYSTAIQYAIWLNYHKGTNIRTVLTGDINDDKNNYSGNLSLEAFRILTILTCIGQNDWSWQIGSAYDPYLRKKTVYKYQNIRWAFRKSFPVQYTRSCSQISEIADGKCYECRIRLKAFKDAGLEDPICYQKK